MTLINDQILLLLVMFFAGVIGGYGGYLMGPPDPGNLPPEKRRWYLKRSLVMGVVAAYMAPIFLRFVGFASSGENLIDKLFIKPESIENWLVFFGLCLVASVSSQRFISKVTDTLLTQALEESKNAKEVTKELSDKLVELEEDVQIGFSLTPSSLSENTKAILFAIYSHSKRRPNFKEISESVSFEKKVVHVSIQELEDRKLIDPKEEVEGKTWRVRTAGKAIVGISQMHVE